MESKICTNASCRNKSTHEWKRGWALRSGGYADLCYNCGSAYENLVYCETFHSDESGWRNCFLCGKRLHCGCIASKSLLELLDSGGVGCTSCDRSSLLCSSDQISNGFGASTLKSGADMQSPIEIRVTGDKLDDGRLSQLCKFVEANEPNFLPQSLRGDTSNRPMLDGKDMHESLAQQSLSITIGVPSGTSNLLPPFVGGIVDREQSKTASLFQQGQRSRPIYPKPSKSGLANSSETIKGMFTQPRIARPPVDGRGKSQLLPRYWPRITDQELQQLAGDLNSTIVPLFEKVLSASDAGRIGRLVLPKACAEAYFPPIHQSEGLPLKVQDVKGNEWTFQFRFWPNNNSRMYVLEGVTPCIQSMQLRAGDTVIFSRIDPGNKLVMGFRKAANSVDAQECQTSALSNGAPSGDTSFTGVVENLLAVNGYSGILQTPNGSNDPHINALAENLNLADGDIGWHNSDNHGGRINGNLLQQPVPCIEKKKTRNIGSKSKRLLMNSADAMELRLTWEEAQDLLRPPPSVSPSIVTIEDYEFEEYDEPPVFGKKTIFTARISGGEEQWVQCDDCSKWRRLPSDALLPPKWTCLDNVWDSSRCSCSLPEDMSPKELENLIRGGREFKKRRIESHKSAQECEPSGLDALASAAVLGDMGDSGEPSVGATTRHPRHRPGCTCIVCIQPPSGKGKHKPTCTCNVCMTVKRRFKTLMLRKKKRQSEREAGMPRKEKNDHNDESEINGTSGLASLHINQSPSEDNQSKIKAEVAETSTGRIDLNCDPSREDMQPEVAGMSMMSLVEKASLPIVTYIKQSGLGSLISEQQTSQLMKSSSPPPPGTSC